MEKPSPHRETDLYFNKIIIGSSVEALIVAFKYGIPIFGNVAYKPLPYYYLAYELDLSAIQIANKTKKFTYLSKSTSYKGMQRIELWDTMMHRLSISGLAPMFGDYALPELDLKSLPEFHNGSEDILLKLYVKGRLVNIHIKDKIILFDYPKYQSSNKIFMVNDTIKLHSIIDMDASLFLSQDCDFMNTLAYETIFYKRDKKMLNCCVKSIISEKVLNEWKYSATSVRLLTEKTIFWNIDKHIRISLGQRCKVPMLTKLCESIEDIIDKDILDEEIYG